MRREIFALLLLSVIGGAALDQSYMQAVSRNGASVIEKTMEVTLFSNQLSQEGLARMGEVCRTSDTLNCSVDVENKKITMAESFSSGGYYTLTSDYGIPFITYTLTLGKVPTDEFSNSLERLLVAANATEYSGGSGAVKPIDLADREANAESAGVLKMLKANLTYTITMPSQVSEARAGNISGMVSGPSARFDLVSVMEESAPIVVRSQEPNYGYIIAIAGVVVLAALAFSFLGTRPDKAAKRKR
ncbi:hypothetical protein L0Y65_06185 [Candidatus Micrarchaeota archaeon]|nr:hypothetical protein [Candidatus Micrarchaeota archaeon]